MYGKCSRSPDSLRREKKDTEKLYIFPVEFETFLALQAVHVEVG